MKRYFVALVALLLGMQAASAQTLTQGSLVVLHGEEFVKVVADYSNALIMDLTEEEFAEWEEDWYKPSHLLPSRDAYPKWHSAHTHGRKGYALPFRSYHQ